jgi:hypothetical protein
MKNATLKVNSTANMCLFWIAAFSPLLLLILGFAFFGIFDDSSVVNVLLSILWIAISVWLIIFALYSIQRAEISEEGITIYSVVFSTIKVIKWNELIDVITMEPISIYSAYNSRMVEDWIVLYTDPSQEEKWHSMVNRKKAGPWYITCTKENITVLTEYIIKYAPHICDDPDVFL